MFHLQGQLVIIHHRVSREDLEHQSCYFKPLPCSEHRSCNGIYSVLTSCSISAVKSNCSPFPQLYNNHNSSVITWICTRKTTTWNPVTAAVTAFWHRQESKLLENGNILGFICKTVYMQIDIKEQCFKKHRRLRTYGYTVNMVFYRWDTVFLLDLKLYNLKWLAGTSSVTYNHNKFRLFNKDNSDRH